MPVLPARKRAQAIALGRGNDQRLAVPLAFELAANISARPLDVFATDPTQLANGLVEFKRATGSDVLCCTLTQNLAATDGDLSLATLLSPGTALTASIEACRRLRLTLGDQVAVLAGLPGPNAFANALDMELALMAPVFTSLVKEFCSAGTDLILLFDTAPEAIDPWRDTLKTAANIARFHRAYAMLWDEGPLPSPARVSLHQPSLPPPGVVCSDAILPATTDLESVRSWVLQVSA